MSIYVDTSKLVVGNEVAIYEWSRFTFGWIIQKVTPAGQVVVARPGSDTNRRFNKRGDEIGVEYSRGRLHTNVEELKEREAANERQSKACLALVKVRAAANCNPCWDKETQLLEIARLEALLVEARKLAEAI